MFASKRTNEEYHLLKGEDQLHEEDDHQQQLEEGPENFSNNAGGHLACLKTTSSKRIYHCLMFLGFLNLVLVALSFSLLVRWARISEKGQAIIQPPLQIPGDGVTPYAQLGRDPSAPWPHDTGYGPEITNHTLLAERWESISINDGIITIDHLRAYEMNLGPSQNLPWDESKGLYVITAYHTVHCLMTLHRLVYEPHHGLPRTRDTGHALHCLAHMRTDAMCEVDDFLLPHDRTQYMRMGPRGQPRVCRSWDQLVDWARGHHACYQHISDGEEKFALKRDETERYFGCPEDSPYYTAMMKYKTEKGY